MSINVGQKPHEPTIGTDSLVTTVGFLFMEISDAALGSTGSLAHPTERHARLAGHLTVWPVCSLPALLAALSLLMAKAATTIEVPREEAAV